MIHLMPCRLHIHLAFTYSVPSSSAVWSELGPSPPFPPTRVLEVQWSRAFSLVCDVTLLTDPEEIKLQSIARTVTYWKHKIVKRVWWDWTFVNDIRRYVNSTSRGMSQEWSGHSNPQPRRTKTIPPKFDSSSVGWQIGKPSQPKISSPRAN